MKWKFFSLLPGLLLAHAALATDPLYQNDAVLNYVVPGNPPPNIDATNFVNESVFSVVFDNITFGTEFYEPWNTVNYTNTGFMSVDTTWGYYYYTHGGSMGFQSGFQFDTQTTNVIPHQMAGSFYNAGTISCGTDFGDPAQLIVSATNIANPGEVDIGPNGFMVFTGGNVDLSRSTVAMNGFNIFDFPAALGLDWGFGLDTNRDWSPTTNLTPTSARSSRYATVHSPFFVNYTFLDNPTPFFNVEGAGTSNVVLRTVFVQNSNPDVSYNVYFSDSTPLALGGGNDSIQDTIEWTGSYIDPATGQTAINYLYLNDATLLTTNNFASNGIPKNFKFVSSTTPFSLGSPASSDFPYGLFGINVVTNFYSYVNAQLVSTTVATNPSPSNPSGALTNLPGRIQVTANRELDLNLAYITGPNYLTLTATNQFDGSAGAAIVSPYSDISLGVTNGFLAATNLLQAALPNWNGTIQAWSGRWLFVTNGITNDFRVLLVSSQVSPTTLAQVQHLNLYSRTNSVVISDVFNVFGTLFIDATNLTLTTNGYGNGATSPEGELNLESGAIVWPGSLPNLRNLTNSGAIRSQNLINFGSATPVYITNTTPAMPAVAAAGTLSEVDTSGNVATNNKVTIGTNTYAFVNTISNKVSNQIKIATTFDGSMSNLIAAINHAAGAGTSYSTNVTANKLVTAGLLTNHSFAVTARTNGSSGNSIVTTNSTATTNLTWNGHATLFGWVDYVPGTTNISTVSGTYDNFINHGFISDKGATIYVNYFESDGTFANNSLGSFTLQSQNTVLTDGSLTAGGNVSITTGSLAAGNLGLQAGGSLMLRVTNQLTDDGVVNDKTWSVGGASMVGLNLPIKPLAGDLLGTAISCTAPGPNKQVVNTWAGANFGVSIAGYTNNEAIGVLTLDALGTSSSFKFNGTALGTTNGLYVDELVLLDSATNFNGTKVNALSINANLVIYYAQAMVNGVSVAEKLNGLNGGHLRWVPQYTGHFSTTNIVYPGGATYAFNAALAQSSDIDSDGDGIPNGSDPTPFFVPSMVNLAVTVTNVPPPLTAILSWDTIPLATNSVFYSTNSPLGPFDQVLTNFVSPIPYPSPAANVSVSDTVPFGSPSRYYRVAVTPSLTYPF